MTAAVAGGSERAALPVEQRPAVRAVIHEPDPVQQLRLYAHTQPGIWARVGPLLRVLEAADASEPELRLLQHDLLPVVLREIDDHKRAGRNETLREAARRAERRLKKLRDNGDVSSGVKVAGDVWAVFEHIEPRTEGLPSWLDLTVPDDRLVASVLLLVSRHPGATTTVATGDLNLQTKLSAVRLPFIDPEA